MFLCNVAVNAEQF